MPRAAQPLPAATVITLTIGKTEMDVNGMTVALDAAPVIKESRTMLPIRAIAEAVNASVAWDPVARKVTITRGSTRIELWIGKSVAKLNGKSVQYRCRQQQGRALHHQRPDAASCPLHRRDARSGRRMECLDTGCYTDAVTPTLSLIDDAGPAATAGPCHVKMLVA